MLFLKTLIENQRVNFVVLNESVPVAMNMSTLNPPHVQVSGGEPEQRRFVA
jgi:hypothetical protein